ncbi:MAG: DUF4038 domain-containing protein [Daejeonella sp.]|uniref:apiosidase-like domain-containing protein n=1 Tax=Daejeonella sp. TaxID=2805397 RepID=UPI003C711F7C
MKGSLSILFIVLYIASFSQAQLKVSSDQRFLQSSTGKPFFWLGDTAWELFHRLDREEAEMYLEDRAKKGFTVIQAVILAELDGRRRFPLGLLVVRERNNFQYTEIKSNTAQGMAF